MKKTIQYIGMAALCLFLSSATLAQTAALKIGDKVPDITINNFSNYKTTSAKLSDFKGKLLILDFWATWCGSCIASMPKLQQLQEEFGDKIQIVSVTRQDRKVIDVFRTKNSIFRNFRLPLVVADQSLSALFPHKLVPHMVWISAEGKLLASTSGYDANSKTIQTILKGKESSFTDHKSDDLSFNRRKPLFRDGNGGDPPRLYSSFITRHVSGLPAGNGFQRDSAQYRLYAINTTLSVLYSIGLGIPQPARKEKRVIYDGKALPYKVTDFTLQKNTAAFCYEMSVSREREADARKMMIDDLDRYFGLRAAMENRDTECWVLVRTTPDASLNTTAQSAKSNPSTVNAESNFIGNQSISALVNYLDALQGVPPVVDETNYAEPVAIKLSRDLRNLEDLNVSLAAYGLKLIRDIRKLQMLVIKDY